MFHRYFIIFPKLNLIKSFRIREAKHRWIGNILGKHIKQKSDYTHLIITVNALITIIIVNPKVSFEETYKA